MSAQAALRAWLVETGATQVELADRLGCAGSYVSHLCAGRRRPGLEVAVMIERLSLGRIRAVDWVPVEDVAEAAA